MQFGDLDDKNSRISNIISEIDTFQLKSEEGTHPSIYYRPPRPKREI